MKKSIILFALLIWGLSACEDLLDTQPYHSIPSNEAITDAKDVARAINGCYSAMQSVGYYARHYIIFGDLAADNLRWTGTHDGYDQVNNNNILADNVYVESIWSSIYIALNRVNNTLAAIPGIDPELMDDTSKNRAMAELRFLRALHHYNLMRLFGPIPIRTMPATAADADLNIPRESLETVLDQVYDDLDYAMEHMTEQIIQGRASKAAAQALKARVSLHDYFIGGNSSRLDEAISHASAVINDYGLGLDPDFANLFSDGGSNESVFELAFNEQEDNRLSFYFFPTALSGRYEVAPPQEFIDSFSEDDLRKDVSIGFEGDDPFGNKYTDIQTGTDNVYIFRLAEMHLIRAEAMILKEDADLDQIREDINAIRERAGLLPVTTSNYPALLQEVEVQRQKEFAFEGHRWFDLVRTSRAIEVLENVTSENQLLFPIPLSEILANDHEGMYQNEGY